MRASEFINEVGLSRGRTFQGSPCTKDCSGHHAGYIWAKTNGIKNRRLCPFRASHRSFTNGCMIAGDEEENK